jgi:hypothetical protein
MPAAMAILWSKVKELVEYKAVADRIEQGWDAEIERSARETLTTSFSLAFHQRVSQPTVEELVHRYKAAGWSVEVRQLSQEDPTGGLVLTPPHTPVTKG